MLQSWAARALRISPRDSRLQRRASRRCSPPTLRPRLEILEDRTLPSIAFTNFSVPPTTPSSGQLTLNGTISDTNSPTSVSVAINWGDTTSTTVSASATSTPGIFVFSATHAYPNPPSAGNPVFTVTALAQDSTGDATNADEAALAVDGLQGSESITVAPGSNSSVQVTVGTFTGSFNPPFYGGPVVVFGGPSASAADAIAVNEGLSPPVTVYGGVQDALTVNDSTPADAIALTSNTVATTSGTVTFSGLSSLLVSGLGGGDSVTMTGIAAGVATTVDGVSGNTSFSGTFGSTGFNGNLTLNNFVTAKLTDAGNFSGDLTVNSPGNLQQLNVAGTIAAGSSISLAGSLSGGAIGTNAGIIGAGSISGMSFTTNNGTIRAAGQGTISNVGIGTNNGTFAAVEGTTPGSGRMTSITIGSNTGIVSAGSFSAMFITNNSGTVSAAGQGTTSNVSIGTNSGTFAATEDTSPGSGTMTSTTIGTNSGTVSAGSISTMSVTSNSGSISAAGQGTTSNVSIGTNTGTFAAVEDANSGSGTMTSTTIGSNAGTVSAGSISTMSVTTNSGTVSAAGQGTTSNVTINSNTSTGTFAAVEDTSPGSGTMTSTTIGSNAGTVSAGSISTMSVTTNSGTVSAAGQGTTSNVSIGTNTGTFAAVEDANSGSGTMTSTTIGSNAGTVSAGSISTMSVTTNSGTVSAAGQGTTSNVSIGTNTGTFAAAEDTSPGSGTMTSTTIGTNSGTVSAGSISTMSVTTNSGTVSAAGQGTTSNVTIGTNTGTFAAVVDATSGSGTMTSTTIGSNAGSVSAGSISTMSVGINNGSISAAGPGTASNVTIGTIGASGTFMVTGTLTDLNVTAFSGLVVAGHVGKITALNSPGASRMLDVMDGGVTRQLVLTPASGSSLPQFVNYVYDHTGGGDPQLTLAVNDGTNTGSYDIELLTSAAPAGSGLDLAALYAASSSVAHVRNVLVEGNLTPTAADAGQVGISSGVGGVQLPGVALGSVGIMGNAPAGSVSAASVQAVSFASITESSGTVAASAATPTDAAKLLAPGTAIVQANNSFLAAAGQTASGQSQPVALFLDTGTSGAFDPKSVLLGNQGNVIGAANPVIAQVTATVPKAGAATTIQTMNLTGDGGSIQTAQLVASAITSSGALGDLLLQAAQGIVANITAPSIFGNINAPNGPISSIIQTTAGNIGRTFTANGKIIGVTSIQTPSALSGEIISAADLISQVTVGNSFTSSGVIAAGGNLGYLDPSTLNRFGGLSVSSGFNGDAVALGNIFGDISITGGLSGRIAAQGASDILGSGRQGILGNINISGGIRNTAAVVSGGELGDNGLGTGIIVNSGAAKGILAAVGPISSVSTGQTKFAFVFNDVGDPSSPQYAGGANLAAINAIFSGLSIGNLTTIVSNLNRLHVGSDGNLSDS